MAWKHSIDYVEPAGFGVSEIAESLSSFVHAMPRRFDREHVSVFYFTRCLYFDKALHFLGFRI